MKKFIGDQIKRFFETGKWAMKLIYLVVLVELGLIVGVVATMGEELTDEDGNLFPDNDERAIFFAKGVIETVKKTIIMQSSRNR